MIAHQDDSQVSGNKVRESQVMCERYTHLCVMSKYCDSSVLFQKVCFCSSGI